MQKLSRIFCLLALVSACNETPTPTVAMSTPKKPGDAYPVRLATARHAPIDLAATAAQEEEIIREAVSLVPQQFQEQLRAKLKDPNTHFSSTSDPHMTELLQSLYTLRRDSAAEARRLESVKQAAHANAKVLLAISQTADPSAPVATVFRRRLLDPTDLIVLRSDATAIALAAALGALSSSREHIGDDLQSDVRIDVQKTGSAQVTAQLQKIWDQLQASKVQEVPGVGNARAHRMVLTPRNQAL